MSLRDRESWGGDRQTEIRNTETERDRERLRDREVVYTGRQPEREIFINSPAMKWRHNRTNTSRETDIPKEKHTHRTNQPYRPTQQHKRNMNETKTNHDHLPPQGVVVSIRPPRTQSVSLARWKPEFLSVLEVAGGGLPRLDIDWLVGVPYVKVGPCLTVGLGL